MMDPISIAPLVISAWSFIAPYAKKAAGKLVEKAGESLPDVVGKIWDTVKGKMEENPDTKALPADLVAAPDDQDMQGAFKYQLKKLLENDEAFARRLEALVTEAKQQGATYTATLKGDGAIAQGERATAVGRGGVHIGGNASNNMIITGDKKFSQQRKEKEMTDDSQRAEIQKIEETIRNLQSLKEQGLLTAEQADTSIEALQRQLATYQVELHGSGASAQGENAKAAGERAVLAEGDIDSSVINTGDYVEINLGAPRAKKESLRKAYLSYVFEQVSPLALGGVVRQSASEAETRMNLSAVYTALLTQIEIPKTFLSERDALGLVDWELKNILISVVESMNKYDHMVLLGDPGSGKSTLINFVALSMAGEALGRRDANLKTLTQPLPQDHDKTSPLLQLDQNPVQQPWDHGTLIPVRIILRDFAARGLPQQGRAVSAENIWNFIESELNTASLNEFAPLLKKELREHGGLILFDGLDEVPEAESRREQMRAAIESFSAAFPHCRYLVTSRTYAYQKQDWKLMGFTETVLAPFTKGQIANFVDRWYDHISLLRSQNPQEGKGKAGILKRAIFASERLMGLAERPLLLTLMASLHAWRGGTLPDKREKLYADAVDLLLERWESQRIVRDPKSKTKELQPSLAEWLKVDREKVRNLLNQLAYEAHAGQGDLVGTADIPESALIAGLMNLSQNPDVKPGRLIEYLRDRAGLLIPRGVGIYTFPHRTFQEYLAACHLTDHDYPELIARLARTEPNRWRETTLLVGAKAAGGAAVFALWSLVDALSPERENKIGDACYWGAQIAGQAVIEIADLEKISESTQPKIDRLCASLLDIMEGNRLPAIERAQAGISLSTLGDPRFDSDLWHLPADETLGFTLIPAGEFIMGSNIRIDEKPQHEVTLPDFWMAKYPVTVEQFRMFTKGTGYSFRNWRFNQIATSPIVCVDWYDTLEYIKWLNKELNQYAKKQIKDGVKSLLWQGLAQNLLHVTLPSEEEWEKASRGSDDWLYPWGNEFDSEKANTDETNIGNPSVVGCFPAGASPYGLLDMSGNVWEWTLSNNTGYYNNANDGREEIQSKDLRVLRGGSFLSQSGRVRCGFRYGSYPKSWDGNFGFRIAISPVPSS